jgi:SAM-dependent methyltransferase
MSECLETIYSKRFAGSEALRDQVWRVLTCDFFQRWVKEDAAVLDLGAGYCEFINNIRAARKYALDLNPSTAAKAATGIIVLTQDVSKPWALPSASLDVVFTSNFFEHLPSKQALQHCMTEALRILRPGGRLLALGPNIRFCGNVYWDFFDHHLPLSDRSLTEGLEITGFHTEKVVEKFLPFTMKGKLPPSPALVRAYLKLPWAWTLWGKQFFVVARKP